jgi:hypothetical protein
MGMNKQPQNKMYSLGREEVHSRMVVFKSWDFLFKGLHVA